MGKYTAQRGKFPEAPRSEYWAKIDAFRQDYIANGVTTYDAVAERIRDVAVAKEEMEEEVKTLGYQLAALEKIMLDRLEADKLDSTTNKFGTFSRQDVLQVTMEDRVAFYAWIKANGMDDLFSINANTASMIVKEAVLSDKDLPPGTSVSMRTTLKRSKSKND